MTLQTPNLSLPYMAAAQAQKHVTHNEALRMIDALVQMSVGVQTDMPPVSPINGDRVLIGDNPQNDFAGNANQIAAYQDGAWAYFAPQTGWRTYVEDQNIVLIYDGIAWVSSSASVNPTDLVGVNATADANNRLSVKSPASLFDQETGNHQLKVNKASAADTSSLVFQTNYAGRAEIGLTGDDDLHIKTSTDGSNFDELMRIESSSKDVIFPRGFNRHQMTSNVNSTGGPGEVYGPPNLSTVTYNRGSMSLAEDRMYFCSFFVDRPTELTGGFVSLYEPSTTSGAVLRCGIYHLGQANNNNWDVGDRVVDFGTLPADQADNKIFTLGTPITLEPGWYVSAAGVNGVNAEVRYLRTLTPGVQHFAPDSSGTDSDVRMAGAGIYLYSNTAGTEITNGLPAQWPANPVIDVHSPNTTGYLIFIPRWQVWG